MKRRTLIGAAGILACGSYARPTSGPQQPASLPNAGEADPRVGKFLAAFGGLAVGAGVVAYFHKRKAGGMSDKESRTEDQS